MSTIPQKIYGPDVDPLIAAAFTKERHSFYVYLNTLVRDGCISRAEAADIKDATKYANRQQLQSIDRLAIRHRMLFANDLRNTLPQQYYQANVLEIVGNLIIVE